MPTQNKNYPTEMSRQVAQLFECDINIYREIASDRHENQVDEIHELEALNKSENLDWVQK
jgi:hypothetical protein